MLDTTPIASVNSTKANNNISNTKIFKVIWEVWSSNMTQVASHISGSRHESGSVMGTLEDTADPNDPTHTGQGKSDATASDHSGSSHRRYSEQSRGGATSSYPWRDRDREVELSTGTTASISDEFGLGHQQEAMTTNIDEQAYDWNLFCKRFTAACDAIRLSTAERHQLSKEASLLDAYQKLTKNGRCTWTFPQLLRYVRQQHVLAPPVLQYTVPCTPDATIVKPLMSDLPTDLKRSRKSKLSPHAPEFHSKSSSETEAEKPAAPEVKPEIPTPTTVATILRKSKDTMAAAVAATSREQKLCQHLLSLMSPEKRQWVTRRHTQPTCREIADASAQYDEQQHEAQRGIAAAKMLSHAATGQLSASLKETSGIDACFVYGQLREYFLQGLDDPAKVAYIKANDTVCTLAHAVTLAQQYDKKYPPKPSCTTTPTPPRESPQSDDSGMHTPTSSSKDAPTMEDFDALRQDIFHALGTATTPRVGLHADCAALRRLRRLQDESIQRRLTDLEIGLNRLEVRYTNMHREQPSEQSKQNARKGKERRHHSIRIKGE